MNNYKSTFTILFLLNFIFFGFSLVDENGFELQDNIKIKEIYNNSSNYFIYILIFGFTLILIPTIFLAYKHYGYYK